MDCSTVRTFRQLYSVEKILAPTSRSGVARHQSTAVCSHVSTRQILLYLWLIFSVLLVSSPIGAIESDSAWIAQSSRQQTSGGGVAERVRFRGLGRGRVVMTNVESGERFELVAEGTQQDPLGRDIPFGEYTLQIEPPDDRRLPTNIDVPNAMEVSRSSHIVDVHTLPDDVNVHVSFMPDIGRSPVASSMHNWVRLNGTLLRQASPLGSVQLNVPSGSNTIEVFRRGYEVSTLELEIDNDDVLYLEYPLQQIDNRAFAAAIRAGDIDRIKDMIARGASLSRSLMSGGSAGLQLAQRHPDLVLELARDSELRNYFAQLAPPMVFALVSHGQPDVADELARDTVRLDPAVTTVEARFYASMVLGDVEAVRSLAASSELQEVRGQDRSRDPMRWSAMQRDAEMVEALIDADFVPGYLTNSWHIRSILIDVIEAGDFNFARELVDLGVGLENAEETEVRLQAAVDSGAPGFARLLVEIGVDPDHRIVRFPTMLSPTISTVTPLYYALETGQLDVARALLEVGADATIPSIFRDFAELSHRTVLDLAPLSLVEELHRSGAQPFQELLDSGFYDERPELFLQRTVRDDEALTMLSSPDPGAPSIGTVPRGAQIAVVTRLPIGDLINERTEVWEQIIYERSVGWVRTTALDAAM